jgi:chromosome segregation ATPase
METELQDVRTLRITNRELSEACERRANTIDELRGRLELAEQRLDEAEEEKKRSNEMILALEEACTEMRKEWDAEKGSMSEKEVELGMQIDQLIEQGKKDNDECVRLQQVVLALDNRLAKQDQDIRNSLEDEIQQRTKMLAQDHSDKMLQQLAKMNKLEAEFAKLQQEHADLQHSHDLLRAKLVTVSDELHRRNNGNGDTAELKILIQQLEDRLEFSNEQISTLTREQGNAHEVVSRLQQTNVDLIAQASSQKSACSKSLLPL